MTATTATTTAPAAPARSTRRTPYVVAETARVLRNTQYLVFSVGMPLVLYLVFSTTDDGSTLDGLRQAPYIMVSMATFGAMGGVLSTAGRIAQERSTGWHRQLRLTALTGRQYVAAKAATGFAVAVPSLVVVFTAAALTSDVRMSAGRWLLVGGSVLLPLVPLCALGIWLGFAATGENMQAVSGGLVSLLALLGGLWLPLPLFPGWVQGIGEALPVAWVAEAGRAALRGDALGLHGAAVLAGWTLVLVALAVRACGRDAARA
jgi:ABC-2 type transport system permease protein